MRKRIFEIIEVAEDDDKASKAYDLFMIITIITSIVPLAFVEQRPSFVVIDKVTLVIFIIDYILRLITADFKLERKGMSFLLYPITPLAIIDMISILSSTSFINSGFKMLRLLRLLKTLKVLKVFKAVRYSKNIQIIINVLKKQSRALLMVCFLAIGYILITALIALNVEPQTFENYFKAVYWATVSLTAMGYGDIYPISEGGQILTMISSMFGIAVVALPAGIITAGYMQEVHDSKIYEDDDDNDHKKGNEKKEDNKDDNKKGKKNKKKNK